MEKVLNFYLLNSKNYRKLRYDEKVSKVAKWLRDKELILLKNFSVYTNKNKLVYLVEINETELKEFYALKEQMPFLEHVTAHD